MTLKNMVAGEFSKVSKSNKDVRRLISKYSTNFLYSGVDLLANSGINCILVITTLASRAFGTVTVLCEGTFC